MSTPVRAAPRICTGPLWAWVSSHTTTIPNTIEWLMASESMALRRSTRNVPTSEPATPTSTPVSTIISVALAKNAWITGPAPG